ncbi:hypothetical protein DNU06_13530 [Putridiphycobacter roseus]|uniref:Thiamine phosphate synthase/TenI domain-containing protein n=1 Tax=Putridiphycobacter roseus TaxID=2219161 RepID=A0A2W1MW52_9FLAO|nr:thiamine phosphate synthase [Putridiphycobacter roseus]PZE16329.1 hypothetical protein DNU06_13530 [Putridiphycobacter roseus]
MLKIILSYPTPVPNEISLINQVLASDIDYFHLRKPDYPPEDLIKLIEAIDEAYYYKIIIHNNFHLIKKYGLGGIHLNKAALSQICTIKESDKCHIEPILLLDKKLKVYNQIPDHISYSAHSFEEIENLPFETDYVFLSPIFNSISKPDYPSKFEDHNYLRSQLKNTNRTIIALGGVTEEKAETIKNLGFSGYVLLGEYWKDYLTSMHHKTVGSHVIYEGDSQAKNISKTVSKHNTLN